MSVQNLVLDPPPDTFKIKELQKNLMRSMAIGMTVVWDRTADLGFISCTDTDALIIVQCSLKKEGAFGAQFNGRTEN